jgi:predicted amidohydrolase
MQDLTVALLQVPLGWENPKQGLSQIQKFFQSSQLPDADLYILPEMFTTGFTMNASSCAEDMQGPAIQWMQAFSRDFGKYISGTLIIEENGHRYNRLVLYGPEGLCGYYDKKHLFRMAGEDAPYTAGTHKFTYTIKGWRISFWICYDLRFPIWMRNSGLSYDLAVVCANWPERRVFHWDTLLKARAIENQSCVAGVNRTGMDGNDIPYSGHSILLDATGKSIAEAGESEGWVIGSFSHSELLTYREKFAAWKDADAFTLD